MRGLFFSVVVLGVCEAIARAFPSPSIATIPAAVQGDSTLMTGSPWLLWELIPGKHQERGGQVRINAAGFRDQPRGPKTRPRAVALGDSSVYGFGNDDDEVFTSVLESRINADFINAAVPGYSSFQSLNLLRGRVLALNPDLLLVASLWSDNNFDEFSDANLLASYAGWEVSDWGKIRVGLEYSALFRRLDWQLRVAPTGAASRQVGWMVGGNSARSGNRRVAIGDYARNLDSFCQIMADQGGGVVYIMLANREDIEPLSAEPAWNPYREVLRGAAARCQAPLVEIAPAFVASGKSADALFIDQMHPTALGHRLMAEAVELALAAVGWPQQSLHALPSSEPPVVPEDPFEGRGTLVEAAGSRGLDIEIEVQQPTDSPAGELIVAVLSADGSGETLGSRTLSEPGATRIQVSRRPLEIRVGITRDVQGDGPTQGDPSTEFGPVVLPGDGPLVVDLAAAEWK